MTDCSLDDFPRGASFELEIDGGPAQLRVADVAELPATGREGGSFRVELAGPADRLLPQATYRFRRGEAEFEMFIVPVARDPDGIRYEAIFC